MDPKQKTLWHANLLFFDRERQVNYPSEMCLIQDNLWSVVAVFNTALVQLELIQLKNPTMIMTISYIDNSSYHLISSKQNQSNQ